MVTIILQARMGSTRLAGKVAMNVQGKPMLLREIERISHSSKADEIVVATTENAQDDEIVRIAEMAGVSTYRGSEKDVLDRYYQAARGVGAQVVVRITGDCPLHDPGVVDAVVERYFKTGADYTKQPENYPEGLDTEVFSFVALEASWKEAVLPSEREHVTLFIRNHPERFKLDEWRDGAADYSKMHWSVDTAADFEFVTKVYEYMGETMFHMTDVLDLLKKKPELLEINKGGTGFEGLAKSLKEDEEWKQNHGKK